MGKLDGKVAVVTGGSSGIGRATAIALAAEGAAVAIGGRKADALAEVAGVITSQGGRAITQTMDVRDEKQVAALVDAAVNDFGPLDIMVNNAGVSHPGNISDGQVEHWREMLETNVLALLIGCREAVRAMKSTGSGSIVNISSVAARATGDSGQVYSATKHAVNAISDGLRQEVHDGGHSRHRRHAGRHADQLRPDDAAGGADQCRPRPRHRPGGGGRSPRRVPAGGGRRADPARAAGRLPRGAGHRQRGALRGHATAVRAGGRGAGAPQHRAQPGRLAARRSRLDVRGSTFEVRRSRLEVRDSKRRRLMRQVLILTGVTLAILLAACADEVRAPAPPATLEPTAMATPEGSISLAGFDIQLAPDTITKVTVGDIPPIFENHPDVIAAELTQTSEGQVSSPSSICVGTMPIRNVTSRLLGSWLSYALVDAEGSCVATRQGDPRREPNAPTLLALETATVSWAGSVTIVGPTDSFREDGITYFPAELVTVRGLDGIYLREEGEPETAGLPLHQLLWIEDGVYWRLIGIDESRSGASGRYNLERLLRVADTLREPAELEVRRTGIAELDAVLDVLFSGDADAVRDLVSFTAVACEAEPVGLGAPPQCRPDEPDGTAVDVYPHAYCEGVYIRPEDMDGKYLSLASPDGTLYAVYRAPETYWPPARYVVIYTDASAEIVPGDALAVSIADGRIIGSYSGCAGTPEEFIASYRLEDPVLPPLP